MMVVGSVKFISETMTSGFSANLFAKVKVKNLCSLDLEITMKYELINDLHKSNRRMRLVERFWTNLLHVQRLR